ncbi:hypothetical protein [Massilia sp. H6]|uniref:hypothetical protein n=1 Tax=Massilia sp. H6 TaxID=2970464 RepID=UPI0021695899|nr:hypothetical protein [Massilia sp. H6]UVW27053.1 hypothetical protein NRS07_10760 [Massilia sp. H6]
MSKKSDNDNRSNQLNPNHAEYTNCRGAGKGRGGGEIDGDYDEPGRGRRNWSGYSSAIGSERIERTRYYFAATAFDGTAAYVRFQTEVTVTSFSRGSEKARDLAENAKDALLGHLRRKCPLGVAYWRLATDESRGEFFWYMPPLTDNEFTRMPEIYGAVERQKMSTWYSTVRTQSQQLDLLFDWGKHNDAVDLGVIKSDVFTIAPETYALANWQIQEYP